MPISETELNQYIAGVMKPYDSPAIRDVELALRIKEGLRAGLVRLNAVPETDRFWEKTNRRPTLYKLGDYFIKALDENPRDDEARWVLIAVALHGCSNSFACGWLEPLVERDIREIRWLVAAAAWVWNHSGFDTSALLRASLARLRASIRNFDEALKHLAEDPNRQLSEAAKAAQRVVRGGRLGSGLL